MEQYFDNSVNDYYNDRIDRIMALMAPVMQMDEKYKAELIELLKQTGQISIMKAQNQGMQFAREILTGE